MARTIFNVACLVVLLGAITLSQTPADPAAAMSDAALRFLDTLDDEQEAAARFPFDSEDRFDWHFIPRERKGVSLKTMDGAQRAAALDLVRTGLSAEGFAKAEIIRQLEQILYEQEGRDIRDPDLYFFMVFGEPGGGSTWGWRYEGHHISQNWTIVDGDAVSATPQFFGSNPAAVRSGPRGSGFGSSRVPPNQSSTPAHPARHTANRPPTRPPCPCPSTRCSRRLPAAGRPAPLQGTECARRARHRGAATCQACGRPACRGHSSCAKAIRRG